MTTIDRWNEWFKATADDESIKAWRAAKQVHTDPAVLDEWATLIELNRLEKISRENCPEPLVVGEP